MSHKPEVVVSVRDIHKEFILPQSKNSSFKQVAVNIVRKNKKVTNKVLDGVSFEIYKGDFFGIVGRNGSGKSTLLKLIAGVYTATAGTIKISGALTPFIELGVGFNPELSGRDNVYLNGALLGFNRKQMDLIYDEIVEFAELEPFMGQKLKNYSSGMQVRLAFSIAVKAKSDILIFDEVLAVGDEAFQKKCIDVFEGYKASGQTVILVTHAMTTVKKFCNRAVLIDEGKVVKIGNPVEIADRYSALNQIDVDKQIEVRAEKSEAVGGSSIKVDVLDTMSKKRRSFGVAESITFDISWDKVTAAEVAMVDLYTNSGVLVSNFITKREGIRHLEGGNRVKLVIEADLAPGSYYIDVGLWDTRMQKKKESGYHLAPFSITSDWSRVKHSFGGITSINSGWHRD